MHTYSHASSRLLLVTWISHDCKCAFSKCTLTVMRVLVYNLLVLCILHSSKKMEPQGALWNHAYVHAIWVKWCLLYCLKVFDLDGKRVAKVISHKKKGERYHQSGWINNINDALYLTILEFGRPHFVKKYNNLWDTFLTYGSTVIPSIYSTYQIDLMICLLILE